MKIHAIQTGSVVVRTRQREGTGHGRRRVLNTLVDREWTEPLPIYAFAIEHPEGVIVVDTGETARVSEPGYFPRWHPYFRFSVRLAVSPEEEIGPQLASIGIDASDVRKVVLTHLHTDHAGGLHHFPRSEILVSRTELRLASGRMGRLRGYPSNRWPSWFASGGFDLDGAPYSTFPASSSLTGSGDVLIVPTPGHTPGHVSVIVEAGDHAVLLAGDSSYNQELMLRGVVDGVAPDETVARLTLERIQAHVASMPTVYLPAHDQDSATRLAERRVAGVSA